MDWVLVYLDWIAYSLLGLAFLYGFLEIVFWLLNKIFENFKILNEFQKAFIIMLREREEGNK